MAPVYLLHGLRIRSQIPLAAAVGDGDRFDVEVLIGERRSVAHHPAEGRLLARLDLPVGSSSVTRGTSGYTLRIHGLCDFEIDPAVRQLTVHVAAGADEELGSLLLGGALSTAVTLRGGSVLHASAVEYGGGAMAFIGGSGMGKSTVAALCCNGGARLVADDALRVEHQHDLGWCYSGSRELRLRTGADTLADSVAGPGRRRGADGRICVRPAATDQVRLPLAAIVTPICSRDAGDLQLERLHAVGAALELLRYPRSLGWIDLEPGRRQFAVLSRLASAVPVYRAQIPWGPPFSPDLGRKVLAEIEARASVGSPALK